jgi:hypothetical protein
MGTVHGPVVAPTFHTGSIRRNIVSLRTIPSVMSPPTGTTSKRCGKYFRLVLSPQPYHFPSVEKRLELVFDGDGQRNVMHSHTRCQINVTEFDYSIVCLRPNPQDFEFVRHEAMVLIGLSESNWTERAVREVAYTFFLHHLIEQWQKDAEVLEFGKLQVERETRAFLLDDLNGPSSGIERAQIFSHLVDVKVG